MIMDTMSINCLQFIIYFYTLRQQLCLNIIINYFKQLCCTFVLQNTIKMTEQQNKYKFDNLQPITFLRKFNKMIEQDQKVQLNYSKNQLRVFPLSKFPLPEFYQQMQGIFETGTKKKDVINLQIKSKDDVQDQQFMVKHRQFMTKAIQNIIQDNQHSQNSYQNYKQFYKPTQKHDKIIHKARSQPKINNNKIRNSLGKTDQKEITAILKSTLQNNVQISEQPVRTYMQKIQFQRIQSLKNIKKQKIKIRDDNKLSSFLDQRKNFMTQRSKNIKNSLISEIKTGRTQYNSISAQDMKKQFMQGLMDLQKQQNTYKKKYAQKIQSQIKKFDDKIKNSVEKTNKQKFW